MKVQNRITEEKRSAFTIIPNIVDDMDLSAIAFRLYVHFKRVAGDNGDCFQSSETLANLCHMSMGAVSKAKRELERAGLIRIEIKSTERNIYHNITIVDLWKMNAEKYSSPSPSEGASPDEEDPSPGEELPSPGETNKIPIKKITREEEITLCVLETWKALFPEKPQPKAKTISDKLKARMKEPDFVDHWREALERGAKTRVLHEVGWFNLTFFLRNDENYQKVLDGWMDWKDEESRNGKKGVTVQDAPAKKDNELGMNL
jgi:hypothetical protein